MNNCSNCLKVYRILCTNSRTKQQYWDYRVSFVGEDGVMYTIRLERMNARCFAELCKKFEKMEAFEAKSKTLIEQED
jgi:hypothetical protein